MSHDKPWGNGDAMEERASRELDAQIAKQKKPAAAPQGPSPWAQNDTRQTEERKAGAPASLPEKLFLTNAEAKQILRNIPRPMLDALGATYYELGQMISALKALAGDELDRLKLDDTITEELGDIHRPLEDRINALFEEIEHGSGSVFISHAQAVEIIENAAEVLESAQGDDRVDQYALGRLQGEMADILAVKRPVKAGGSGWGTVTETVQKPVVAIPEELLITTPEARKIMRLLGDEKADRLDKTPEMQTWLQALRVVAYQGMDKQFIIHDLDPDESDPEDLELTNIELIGDQDAEMISGYLYEQEQGTFEMPLDIAQYALAQTARILASALKNPALRGQDVKDLQALVAEISVKPVPAHGSGVWAQRVEREQPALLPLDDAVSLTPKQADQVIRALNQSQWQRLMGEAQGELFELVSAIFMIRAELNRPEPKTALMGHLKLRDIGLDNEPEPENPDALFPSATQAHEVVAAAKTILKEAREALVYDDADLDALQNALAATCAKSLGR